MANKIIIGTLPPDPSRRVIGGSSQRSAHRLQLQGGSGWQYNHHPVSGEQSENPLYWQTVAPLFDAPLSSSGENLYTRQAIQRERIREMDRQRVLAYTFDLQRAYGSNNQTFNKKPRIRDLVFDSFEPELDITTAAVPNIKKRITFKVTKDGTGYNGENLTPFSVFSSSISTGYRAQLIAAGLSNIDLTNFHTDSILSYGKATPMQGPFTEQYVGGIQARHAAPFRTRDRREEYNLTIASGTGSLTTVVTDSHIAKGQYLRGQAAKAPVNIRNIQTITGSAISSGVGKVGNYSRNYEVVQGNDRAATNMDFAFNSAHYAYTAPTAFLTTPAMLALGRSGSADYPAPRQRPTRQTNQTIIVGTFAAPGSKQDSKQLFRDVRSNQFSPNNVLPFRNWVVRQPFNKNLGTHVTRGGYLSDQPGIPARIKTQRNQTQRVETLSTYPTATYHTGTFYDTAFVTRPVPAGDSTQWFMDLSGSDVATYSNYVLSGSRYPADIQIYKSTLSPFIPAYAGAIAQAGLTAVASSAGATHTKDIRFIDNAPGPNAVLFIAVNSLSLNKSTRASAIKYEFGVASLSTPTELILSLTYAINSASAAGDIFILPGFGAGAFQSLSQPLIGTSGNTAITGTLISYGDITIGGGYAGFALGADAYAKSGFDPGTSGYVYIDGQKRYIWANSPWVPWTQTRQGHKNEARYYSKNNIYQINPQVSVGNANSLSQPQESTLGSTLSRNITDQAGNTKESLYSKQYVEPPVTARYKPLVHQIETFIGTPSKTSTNKTVLSLEYAYGNSLMGFANKELNNLLLGDLKFLQGKVKRPYEVLRDQLSGDPSRAASGISQIKMFSYGETIYPRERYTFLSGTRARLSFANGFWKDDISVTTPLVQYANYFSYRLDQPSTRAIARKYNRQYDRLRSPFINSQGILLENAQQGPFSDANPAYYIMSGSGTSSIWALDSFLWSDHIAAYSTLLTGNFNTPVILGGLSTLPAGELMSVNYGPLDDRNTDYTDTYNIGSSSYSRISTSSPFGLPVNAQYVYSIPFVTGNTVAGYQPEPRSPGDVYSRPPWTAGSKRRYVDGPQRGDLSPSVYPFYDTYEKYAEDVRLIGNSYGILPEFRISENISTYQTNTTPFALVSASLEISGASVDLYNGSAPGFYSRYAITDDMEFLSDFMSYDKSNPNYIFNKFPRHFEINSEAIVKLLPYDGFYPVNRTLQLATLYSQSYGSHAVYTDIDSTGSSAWRPLLRPYFAPGIMYNSIKSGIAVNYPVRRATRNPSGYQDYWSVPYANPGSFMGDLSAYKIGYPLAGCLSQDLIISASLNNGVLPDNSRRGRPSGSWSNADVNALFWADKLPFESIISPENYLTSPAYGTFASSSIYENGPSGSLPIVDSDDNHFIRQNVSASFGPGANISNVYTKAVSNFLANVPQFFLKKKPNKYGSPGYLSKFVSQFGSPPKGSQVTSASERTVQASANAAYMMEIGLIKTDQFNMYNNPHAFGQPTNISNLTGTWDIYRNAGTVVPDGSDWPKHRGEFAPFTPPYYYGPSVMRITFMPTATGDYTLDEIINNTKGEVFVDYINESSSYYDVQSGSFQNSEGLLLETNRTPKYQWNRAWLNRMDIDASVTVGNEFALGNGTTYKTPDPNKWTIMTKWECPALDFPDYDNAISPYSFSSSVAPGEFTQEAQGMWHQYGVTPQDNKGIYLYIKDIPTNSDEEYDRVLTYHKSMASGGQPWWPNGTDFGVLSQVRKVPPFVINSGRAVLSLADLCGFDDDEIIRKGFDASKAKRIGELADDDESSISEAILAMPFYLDDSGTPRLINLQAPASKLGPKIKEFRKNFTKYSLPPALAQKLVGLVPRGYPDIPNYINPFGGDDYDTVLSGEDINQIPVVYLMEHKVTLTKQDLADIWQGIMPDFGTKIKFSFSAVDHYMPGDKMENEISQFPEVLKQQINLGAVRDGHPRYDLLDIAENCKQGFTPDIKWLVFKVKQKGMSSYSEMIMEEVDGPDALSYDNIKELLSLQGLPDSQVNKILADRDEYSKNLYISKHSLHDPTYNWPYDYCSLIESAKINSKVGFRPDLSKEYEEASRDTEQTTRDEKMGKK